MKIKRFYARTMRAALQQVREEQGPDSVILSKQKTADGIEVIAAVDYDEALLHQTTAASSGLQTSVQAPHPAPNLSIAEQQSGQGNRYTDAYRNQAAAPVADTDSESTSPDATGAAAALAKGSATNADSAALEQSDRRPDKPGNASQGGTDPSSFQAIFDAAAAISPVPEPAANNERELRTLAAELQALKETVEQQFDALSWDDLQRREPRLAEVIRRLELLGLEEPLVRSIVARLDPDDPQKKVWRNAIALLARQIPIAEQDVCADGGIFAVVGPTGAGKTTSIAKLAARFALERGADAVGLVTTDSFRIGAQEHLLRFGRILGVPVQVAGDAEALAATLEQLAHKKLVLIDTAGCSPRDSSLLASLAGLTRLTPTVQTLLALPANLQTASMREAIGAFDRLGLDGAIVTKVDEATSLGGLLSELIAAELAVCYVTDGQRVPEDIRPAARYRAGFVSQAVSLARSFATSRPGQSRPDLPEAAEPSTSEELPPLTTTERRLASYG